jgi:hypothetical protein
MKASLFLVAAAFLPGIFLMQANGGPTVDTTHF